MTPDEAVDMLVRTGVTRNDRAGLRSLFEKVAATAKEDETRRCAARVKIWAARQSGTSKAWLRSITKELCNDMLITGGLAVEESDSKMKPGGPVGSSL